ncbi:DUF4347 domain-containing protein [Cyanobium usitatum]|uniref:DUF4347 domain-containing protein n=2 Tax=Cyanobium TaxID=167375 RepID=UPI000FC9BB9C|nr:DUF4347 domain-containing protein [Cyanobium usitatum]
MLVYDAGLPDLDLLFDGLAEDVVAVQVDRDADAISRIAEALSATGARRLQLLCHGRPGVALIGAQPITAAVLREQVDVVSSWNLEVVDLFACQIGADQEFLQLLAQYTGGRVAASKGVVGHAGNGGSWNLCGAISTVVPFSRFAQLSWNHCLETPLSSISLYSAAEINAFVSDPSFRSSLEDSSGNNFNGHQHIFLDLTDTGSIPAADLTALDGLTAGTIDATAITSITGTSTDVAAVYAAKVVSGNGISGLGNEVVIIIGNDAAAADLQNIDAATTGTIDATAINTITGTLAAVTGAYESNQISGLGDKAVTLTDTGSIAADDLTALDDLTAGTIDATAINTITGTATDVAAVYAAKVVSGNGISGLGDEAVILNNAHSLSQLKAINDATTGAITLDNYSVSLNGSAVDIAGALTGITGYSGALTLTDTGSIAADDLTALDGLTTGEVDAKSIKTITGSATDVAAVYAAKVVSGNGILGLGNEVVAVIGMNAAAADLKNINAATTGTIEARSITTITGTATDVAAVYAAKVLSGNGILGLGNEVVVIIGMNADAADLKNINAATSGTVDAKSITTITGTATDVAAVYAAKVVAGNGISGLGNEAVILNTAHSLSQLKAINDATTGAITLNNYSVSLKGSAVDITRALTGITGYSGTLTLTDTGSIAADDLTALDALTTGNVDASSVTTVTGKLLAVSTAYRSNGIVGLGKNAVSLTDSTQTRLGVTASNQDIFYLASNKQKFAISYNGDDNDNRFTGLAGNDIITGKGGSDTLSGGLGIDVLTGDLGADTFRFDTALGSTNVDSITDFNIAEGDIFQLENTGSGLFTAIRETGELASNAFVLGAVFTSIDQRIRYESTKGNLFYDPDGIGSAKSVLFANVSQGLAMSSSQFQIT